MAGAYPVRVGTPCGPRIETAVHSPSDSSAVAFLKATLSSGTGPGTIPRWAAPPAIRPPTAPPSASATPASADEPKITSLQLDALAAADCREVVIETASTRTDRPKLRQALAMLKPGDTLVIYKPDRVARS